MIPDEVIISKIYLVRQQKVMLDSDLAEMYGVETKRLNEQVKRNSDRFPHDFMFQLSQVEFENLKSQFATSSWGGNRKPPFAFTEHGVLMLSGIINSPTAIAVNIGIIRIFTRLREMVQSNKEILSKLEQLEQDVYSNTHNVHVLYSAMCELLKTPEKLSLIHI